MFPLWHNGEQANIKGDDMRLGALLFFVAIATLAQNASPQTTPDACANFSVMSFGAPGAPLGIPAGQRFFAPGPFAAGDTFTVTANGIIPGHPSIPEPGDQFALLGPDGGIVAGPETVYGGTITYKTPIALNKIGIDNDTAVDLVLIASATCAAAAPPVNTDITTAPAIGRLTALLLLFGLGALGIRKLLRLQTPNA
jgi:hypothetical protein